MRGRKLDQRRLLLSRQLEKRKDLIRALFRACGDRTVGERYQSREVVQPLQPLDDREEASQKTVFEKVDAVARPVIYSQQEKKLKWKKKTQKSSRSKKKSKRSKRSRSHSSRRQKRETPQQKRTMSLKGRNDEQEMPPLSEIVSHRDFTTAYKIMSYVKKNGILENTLDEKATEKIRHFFETELCFPSYHVSAKIMRLLHEALNKCWEKIMDDCKKLGFTQEILLLLSEKEKAKACFLDVMLVFPEHIPESWGGKHIVEISAPTGAIILPTEILNLSTDLAAPTSQIGTSAELTSQLSMRQLSQTNEMSTIEERRKKVYAHSPLLQDDIPSPVNDAFLKQMKKSKINILQGKPLPTQLQGKDLTKGIAASKKEEPQLKSSVVEMQRKSSDKTDIPKQKIEQKPKTGTPSPETRKVPITVAEPEKQAPKIEAGTKLKVVDDVKNKETGKSPKTQLESKKELLATGLEGKIVDEIMDKDEYMKESPKIGEENKKEDLAAPVDKEKTPEDGGKEEIAFGYGALRKTQEVDAENDEDDTDNEAGNEEEKKNKEQEKERE
ncbi:hypothetical protein RB195_020588 [Necator americanus]|uniref:DUF7774 domain-containing protein n=1 Tax=Necator americanus TaxID=51031 RepID=A0ABR1CJV5_NECAM